MVILSKVTSVKEDDEEGGEGEDEDEDDQVDLGQLVDGGADAVGVLVDDTWYPSLSCALSLKNDDLELDAVYDEDHDDGGDS